MFHQPLNYKVHSKTKEKRLLFLQKFQKCHLQYNQIYNYLHGFPDSRMIDFEIFTQLNSRAHQQLQIDLNSLYQLLQLSVSGLKESPLFKDSFFLFKLSAA